VEKKRTGMDASSLRIVNANMTASVVEGRTEPV